MYLSKLEKTSKTSIRDFLKSNDFFKAANKRIMKYKRQHMRRSLSLSVSLCLSVSFSLSLFHGLSFTVSLSLSFK